MLFLSELYIVELSVIYFDSSDEEKLLCNAIYEVQSRINRIALPKKGGD